MKTENVRVAVTVEVSHKDPRKEYLASVVDREALVGFGRQIRVNMVDRQGLEGVVGRESLDIANLDVHNRQEHFSWPPSHSPSLVNPRPTLRLQSDLQQLVRRSCLRQE